MDEHDWGRNQSLRRLQAVSRSQRVYLWVALLLFIYEWLIHQSVNPSLLGIPIVDRSTVILGLHIGILVTLLSFGGALKEAGQVKTRLKELLGDSELRLWDYDENMNPIDYLQVLWASRLVGMFLYALFLVVVFLGSWWIMLAEQLRLVSEWERARWFPVSHPVLAMLDLVAVLLGIAFIRVWCGVVVRQSQRWKERKGSVKGKKETIGR